MGFVYYTEDELLNTIGLGFEVVAMEHYKDIEDSDSSRMWFCQLISKIMVSLDAVGKDNSDLFI